MKPGVYQGLHITSININYVPITNSNLYVCRRCGGGGI